MAHNCVFRHLADRASQAAIIYDSPVTKTAYKITYEQLAEKVLLFAGALQEQGVAKGDRVLIYMPNTPEAVIAMLGCATIGAIHSVVFGGFAPAELATRIRDSTPKVLYHTMLLTMAGAFVTLFVSLNDLHVGYCACFLRHRWSQSYSIQTNGGSSTRYRTTNYWPETYHHRVSAPTSAGYFDSR